MLRSVLANHTRICCYVLYCMFQGIMCGRTHGYVVHVSECTRTGLCTPCLVGFFDVLYLGFSK